MSATLKIGLHGSTGRMGSELRKLIGQDPQLTFVRIDAASFSDLDGVDICLDFSHASAVSALTQACEQRRVALLVGTSGLGRPEEMSLEKASKLIPVLRVANTSLGILALEVASQAVAKILGPSFDIEVLELHHKAKKDAPSGTAIALARALGAGADELIYARRAARDHGEIGVASMRGGDIIGDHTIYFLGQGERLELTHRAQSRALFAIGALKLAKLLVGRAPGLYSSRELLVGGTLEVPSTQV